MMQEHGSTPARGLSGSPRSTSAGCTNTGANCGGCPGGTAERERAGQEVHRALLRQGTYGGDDCPVRGVVQGADAALHGIPHPVLVAGGAGALRAEQGGTAHGLRYGGLPGTRGLPRGERLCGRA